MSVPLCTSSSVPRAYCPYIYIYIDARWSGVYIYSRLKRLIGSVYIYVDSRLRRLIESLYVYSCLRRLIGRLVTYSCLKRLIGRLYIYILQKSNIYGCDERLSLHIKFNIYIYIYGYLFPFTLWTERITREDSTEAHYPDSVSDRVVNDICARVLDLRIFTWVTIQHVSRVSKMAPLPVRYSSLSRPWHAFTFTYQHMLTFR